MIPMLRVFSRVNLRGMGVAVWSIDSEPEYGQEKGPSGPRIRRRGLSRRSSRCLIRCRPMVISVARGRARRACGDRLKISKGAAALRVLMGCSSWPGGRWCGPNGARCTRSGGPVILRVGQTGAEQFLCPGAHRGPGDPDAASGPSSAAVGPPWPPSPCSGSPPCSWPCSSTGRTPARPACSGCATRAPSPPRGRASSASWAAAGCSSWPDSAAWSSSPAGARRGRGAPRRPRLRLRPARAILDGVRTEALARGRGRSAVRASDDERELAGESLRMHAAAGRLTHGSSRSASSGPTAPSPGASWPRC